MEEEQHKNSQEGSNKSNLEKNSGSKNDQPGEELKPVTPEPEPAETAKLQPQQPNIIENFEQEKKTPHLPLKSFFVALMTIGITILAGIAIAYYVKTNLENNPSSTQEILTPINEEQFPKPTSIPTKKMSTPSGENKPSQSSNFETFLKPTKKPQPTSSQPITATQGAQPLSQ